METRYYLPSLKLIYSRVFDGPDEFGRSIREWVVFYEREGIRAVTQHLIGHVYNPGIVIVGAQGSKPHLPIKPGLVGYNNLRRGGILGWG